MRVGGGGIKEPPVRPPSRLLETGEEHDSEWWDSPCDPCAPPTEQPTRADIIASFDPSLWCHCCRSLWFAQLPLGLFPTVPQHISHFSGSINADPDALGLADSSRNRIHRPSGLARYLMPLPNCRCVLHDR